MMFRVDIVNWEKNNGRKDVKKSSWFRYHNKAPLDPKIFSLSDKEYRIWDWMLCLASQAGGFSFVADPAQIGLHTKATEDVVIRALIHLSSMGLIRIVEKIEDKVTAEDVERFLVDPFFFNRKRNADDTQTDACDTRTDADDTRTLRGRYVNSDDDARNQPESRDSCEARNADVAIGEERRGEEISTSTVTIVGPVDNVDNSESDISKLARAVGSGHVSARERAVIIRRTAIGITAKLITALHKRAPDEAAKASVGDLGWEVVRGRHGSFPSFRSAYLASYRDGKGSNFETQLRDWTIAFLNRLTSPQKESRGSG